VRQVWDVAAEACQHTLAHHAGKVQAVAWNPAEAPVLLSGAFDQVAALVRAHGFPATLPLSAIIHACVLVFHQTLPHTI
jgi:periodic tryptophan protein 1